MADEKMIKLRKRILTAVDGAPRTAGQIAELLTRGGFRITPAKVGNNLRYLQQGGYVSYTEAKWGKKMWIRTDKAEEYDEIPHVALYVEVPVKLNEELDRVAKKLKMTKSELVREALLEQLGICM